MGSPNNGLRNARYLRHRNSNLETTPPTAKSRSPNRHRHRKRPRLSDIRARSDPNVHSLLHPLLLRPEFCTEHRHRPRPCILSSQRDERSWHDWPPAAQFRGRQSRQLERHHSLWTPFLNTDTDMVHGNDTTASHSRQHPLLLLLRRHRRPPTRNHRLPRPGPL